MDTRKKIIQAEQAIELANRLHSGGGQLIVVTGLFDPLLAAHAKRLAEVAASAGDEGCVLAVVTNWPPEILPLKARAELVAALATVDYVVPCESSAVEQFLARVKPTCLFREEETDQKLKQEFIEHVQRQQETETKSSS